MSVMGVWKVACVTVTLVAGIMGVPSVAWTDQATDAEAGQTESAEKAAMAASAKITIEEAMRAATQSVAGTVIEAELEKKPRPTWEVEILRADGTVVEVWVDVDTGAVVSVEEPQPEGKTDATQAGTN